MLRRDTIAFLCKIVEIFFVPKIEMDNWSSKNGIAQLRSEVVDSMKLHTSVLCIYCFSLSPWNVLAFSSTMFISCVMLLLCSLFYNYACYYSRPVRWRLRKTVYLLTYFYFHQTRMWYLVFNCFYLYNCFSLAFSFTALVPLLVK